MTRLVGHLRRNTVAYLALMVALGGTSYAATALPRDSVGKTQIRTGGVASGEVKDGSLRTRDFKPGQLPAGAAGPTGSPGADGDDGAPGQPGEPGPSVGGGNTCGGPVTGLTAECTFTITAPSAGRLIVSGSGQAVVSDKANVCDGDPSGFTGLEAQLRVDGSSLIAPRLSAGAILDDQSYSLANTQTRDVDAGAHTVSLVMKAATGNCTSFETDPTFRWMNVSAVFVEGPTP